MQRPPARPLTPPCPLSPTSHPPAGREGVGKNKTDFFFCSLPPLPGWAGVRRERRAGEVRGPTARTTLQLSTTVESERAAPRHTFVACPQPHPELASLHREERNRHESASPHVR